MKTVCDVLKSAPDNIIVSDKVTGLPERERERKREKLGIKTMKFDEIKNPALYFNHLRRSEKVLMFFQLVVGSVFSELLAEYSAWEEGDREVLVELSSGPHHCSPGQPV